MTITIKTINVNDYNIKRWELIVATEEVKNETYIDDVVKNILTKKQ